MISEDAKKPGCLGFIIGLLRRLLGRPSKALTSLPYKLRDDFLSPAEMSYYKILTSALGPSETVCPKVRLADILFVARPNENIRFFNRIAQRHVDFLLCQTSNMRPLLVIELDDVSHDRSARKKRDLFMDNALRAAEVPILRVKPRSQYSQEEVAAQLRPFLSGPPLAARPPSREASLAFPPTTSLSSLDLPPICPKCGVPMVLRVASQGEHKGRRFYGCPNFPKCRQVLPFDAVRPAG